MGRPEDVLGPIPSHDELRAELKQLEEDMGREIRESEEVGRTTKAKVRDEDIDQGQ